MTKPSRKRKRPAAAAADGEHEAVQASQQNKTAENAQAQIITRNLKTVSWNVTSLKSSIKKGLSESLAEIDADIVLLQEIKCTNGDVHLTDALIERYSHRHYHGSLVKKGGYAGVAVLSKVEFQDVHCGFLQQDFEDDEGRIMSLVLKDLIVVNCYVPNAGMKLERLDWKCDTWLPALVQHIALLRIKYPEREVVLAGDLNVCMSPLDLARPTTNYNKTPGYTQREIDTFRDIVGLKVYAPTAEVVAVVDGEATTEDIVVADALTTEASADDANVKGLQLLDAWREFNGADAQDYSYYSYRFDAFAKNLGWRLDYFLVENGAKFEVTACQMLRSSWGKSDHCPVVLTLTLKQ